MARVSGCNVVAHHAKIQDFSAEFFAEVRYLCCPMCVEGEDGDSYRDPFLLLT